MCDGRDEVFLFGVPQTEIFRSHVVVKGVKRKRAFVDALADPPVGEKVFNGKEHGALFAAPAAKREGLVGISASSSSRTGCASDTQPEVWRSFAIFSL